jgi:hypothetical protein
LGGTAIRGVVWAEWFGQEWVVQWRLKSKGFGCQMGVLSVWCFGCEECEVEEYFEVFWFGLLENVERFFKASSQLHARTSCNQQMVQDEMPTKDPSVLANS